MLQTLLQLQNDHHMLNMYERSNMFTTQVSPKFSHCSFKLIVHMFFISWLFLYQNYFLVEAIILWLWSTVLTLFRMGFFEGVGVGGKKAPSLKSVTHILQWRNLAHLYLT